MDEIDEALDAIPDLTESQILMLIEYQRQELANYKGVKAKAKKDQSDTDVMSALEMFTKSAQEPVVKPSGFKRRF
jgi:hypothetical protein